MIISASYKTDIPAFYSEWFQRRLTAGYCKMVNPYNLRQTYKVSLEMQDVDGFVFWTKNLGPFTGVLDEVYRQGYPFIVQYTINGYPRDLENRVVDPERSVEIFRTASKKYGLDTCVWRYDTIIFTSKTDADFHRQNFARLASKLHGHTHEVVVSFVQLYKKTRENMNRAGRDHGFDWFDPPAETKRELLSDLYEIARGYDLALSICTQPDLVVPGVKEARCIDAEQLMKVAGRPFRAEKKGMRPNCGCYTSRDIGEYDTCPHGCIYCYAVRNRETAARRYRRHDPLGEFLFVPDMPATAGSESTGLQAPKQPFLFPDDQDSA